MGKIGFLTGVFLQITTAHAETPIASESENNSDFSARFVPAPVIEIPSHLYAKNDERITLACPQIHDVSVERHYANKADFTDAARISFEGKIKTYEDIPLSWQMINLSMNIMETAPEDKSFHIKITSVGGEVALGRTYLDNMTKSDATVITSSPYQASSMASLILFSGDIRISHMNTQIILHEVHKREASTNRIVWDSEMPEADAKGTEETNTWFRDEYWLMSQTNIPTHCVNALVNERDIRVSSMTALKLGWIDRVYLNDNVWYERSNTQNELTHKTVVVDRKTEPTRPVLRPFLAN